MLAARKGLFIVDLENPYEPPRFLAHASRWQVADCQWNPHPARAQWVASTVSGTAIVSMQSEAATPTVSSPPPCVPRPHVCDSVQSKAFGMESGQTGSAGAR